jgi:phosphate transport system substrate-binding protein
MMTQRLRFAFSAVFHFCASMAIILVPVSHAEEPSTSLFSTVPTYGDVQLFRIDGSNTIGAELAPRLVKAWMEARGTDKAEIRTTDIENEVDIIGYHAATNSRLTVHVAAHGSGTGFSALRDGVAQIAAASRPVKSKEEALFPRLNLTSLDSEHIIGIDGLAVIVHPRNPLNRLSVQQIERIFSGVVTDWADVGGTPGKIEVLARDNKSGTWDSFKSMVLGKSELLTTARRFESNSELSAAVANNTNAIGFVGLSSVNNSKALAVSDGQVKALSPNQLTVATEDYALSRRLFMYTQGVSDNTYVRDFLNFALANEGQRLVADTGFVSQELHAVIPENYDELPADFRELTSGAQRLSINFRFMEGSAQLDNKAQRDLDRLAAYLKHQPNGEVVLVGFGDKRKTESRSQLLSKLRAMAVRRELVRQGIYPDETVGFGDELPVAAIQGNDGRMKNRRVEVWLRNGYEAVEPSALIADESQAAR